MQIFDEDPGVFIYEKRLNLRFFKMWLINVYLNWSLPGFQGRDYINVSWKQLDTKIFIERIDLLRYKFSFYGSFYYKLLKTFSKKNFFTKTFLLENVLSRNYLETTKSKQDKRNIPICFIIFDSLPPLPSSLHCLCLCLYIFVCLSVYLSVSLYIYY